MYPQTICIALLIFALIGCASPSVKPARPEPHSLGRDLPAFQAPHAGEVNSVPFEEPTGKVTLRQLLGLALLYHPELVAFSWEVRAQEASIIQAGLLPNPEVGVILENIGLNQEEATIQLSQLIELGGKRSKKVEVASLTRDLAGWDYEAKRLDILARVSQAFIGVLSAQENLMLTQETVRLSTEVTEVVKDRVKAGKVSPIEETRAKFALSSAQIDFNRAQKQLDAARKQLAASWGSTNPRFESVAGELASVRSIPTLEQLGQRLSQNPDLARWTAEISQRRAVVSVEKSQAVPDLHLSGGYRRFPESNDNALLFGITIPLPIFNRNQGRIEAADHRLHRAEEERRAAELRVTTALAEAYRALSISYGEIQILESDVLPGAESAFGAVNEGYRLGKFGLLEVLDSQRTFFSARSQHLNALTEYHLAVAEVERLIGEPLISTLATGEQK